MNRNEMANIPGIAHFKQALATVLRDARVPLKAIASEMEKSASTVYGWADPHDFDNWPSLKALPQLLAYSADTTLIDYLARVQGRTTVLLPKAEPVTDLDRLAEMLEAFSALVRCHANAVADGSFSVDDADLYEQHASRLVKAVLGQIAYVRAVATVTAKQATRVSA